jgi:SAV_6107-like HEPN
VLKPPVPGPALDLLRSALRDLSQAETETAPSARYVLAHLSALRAAAAIVAASGQAGFRLRRRPCNVWELLREAEPTLAEWAAYFAAGARTRANAEAGLPNAASADDADALLKQADTFICLVAASLGVTLQPPLPTG